MAIKNYKLNITLKNKTWTIHKLQTIKRDINLDCADYRHKTQTREYTFKILNTIYTICEENCKFYRFK
jgi:hypothetical protein